MKCIHTTSLIILNGQMLNRQSDSWKTTLAMFLFKVEVLAGHNSRWFKF